MRSTPILTKKSAERFRREIGLGKMKRHTFEEHEDHYIHIQKGMIPAYMIAIFGIICIIFLVYYIGINMYYPIDNLHDKEQCIVGMSAMLDDNIESVTCFANDDFWKINWRHDINCTCFTSGHGIDVYNFMVK